VAGETFTISAYITEINASVSSSEIAPSGSVSISTNMISTSYIGKVYINDAFYTNISSNGSNYTLHNGLFNEGENEIKIEYSFPLTKSYIAKVTLLPKGQLSYNYKNVHLGELAEFTWSVPNEYTSVSVSVKENGSAEKVISTSNSGSYGYLKEEITLDAFYVKAYSQKGTYYYQGTSISGFSVLVPATISTGSASIYLSGVYPTYEIWVNGTNRYTSSSNNHWVNISNSYFDEGDNTVEIIPIYSNFKTEGKSWIGKVIKTTP
jgi:hypothetical protein